jgi:hypothetical protein
MDSGRWRATAGVWALGLLLTVGCSGEDAAASAGAAPPVAQDQFIAGGAGDPCRGDCYRYDDGTVYCSDPMLPVAPNGAGAFCYQAQGLYCGADGTCQARLGTGQPCTENEQCAGDDVCNSVTGTCSARSPVGGASGAVL